MMDFLEFYRTMCAAGMLQNHWRHHLELLREELTKESDQAATADYTAQEKTDTILKLFTIYFSLIDDGNVYMSLDKEILKTKILEKLRGLMISFFENSAGTESIENLSEEEPEAGSDKKYFSVLKEASGRSVALVDQIMALAGFLPKDHPLTLLSQELKDDSIFDTLNCFEPAVPCLKKILSETGSEKLFVTDKERLFTRKYFNSINLIKDKVDKLFVDHLPKKAETYDYKELIKNPSFQLTDGQEKILRKGLYNNLLVTGGPGTGKTTSVFFILMALLEQDPDLEIYLTAPSGKAASRMKDSIISNRGQIKEEKDLPLKRKDDILRNIEKIQNLEEFTIHRLLGTDFANHGFIHNRENSFSDNSIFVIDEASMIDISIFAALLEAIPENARVFIMGDKDQLPSVECGAVFAELLRIVTEENKVQLTESKRFSDQSAVYKLAKAVLNENEPLPVNEKDWKKIDEFTIVDEQKKTKVRNTPIFYYDDRCKNIRKTIEVVAQAWFNAFYKDKQFPEKCNDLKSDAAATDSFEEINMIAEHARILCADNRSVRGTKYINRFILDHNFAGKERQRNFYPGELVMIIKNNDALNLYNGDNGIVVKFKDDDALYVMFKKSTTLHLEEGKQTDKIFKIGNFLFYPVKNISTADIVPAFAITIHKSQGSDYENICVVLPENYGHPLLFRQIVYTAITRTKGNTYIISNQNNLQYAKDTALVRDTGLFEPKKEA